MNNEREFTREEEDFLLLCWEHGQQYIREKVRNLPRRVSIENGYSIKSYVLTTKLSGKKRSISDRKRIGYPGLKNV